MTNEKAIQLLHRLSDEQFDGPHGDERREALEMAVRALEQNLGNNGSIYTKTMANDEETGVNDEDRITDDLISRKQVLNASHFVACWDGVEHFSLEVVDADFIQKLPSVQPTQPNADSTQCNTLDCVSREAVLDAIDKYILGKPEGCNIEVRELLKLITKVYHMPIYRIPSAQPHWIPCSVRMPEDGRRVLFQMTNGYIDVLRFNATGITTHLVAWMPLPKPYGWGDAK